MNSRSARWAFYIFAFVLAIRLLALWRLTASPLLLPSRGDMHFYNDWAQRLLNGQLTDHLAFYGLPLYAYLLAFLYKIFGYSPFMPGFLQACLDAGTATLLFKIAERVFGGETPRDISGKLAGFAFRDRGLFIGIAAAAGWAFFVPAQAYSVILMPTAWLIFIFWLLIWRLVKSERAPTPLASLGYGALIGFTAMGIATIFFLVPLLLLAIVLRDSAGQENGAKAWRKFAAIFMVFLGIAAGTAPCWLHNRFAARDPVFLSAHSGINFWIGNNPVANGYPRIPPGLRAGQAAMLQDSITVAEQEAGRPLKRSEVSTYWSEKAKSHIEDNFDEWLGLMALKFRNFWNAFQYDDLSIITNLREQGVILPGPSFGWVAALALPGMLLAFWKLPRSRWIAAAVALHMTSLLMVFVTERYRLAAVPGLLLFAAFGLWKLWEMSAHAQSWKTLALGITIMASAWTISTPQLDPALWALNAYNSGWQALESNDLPLAQKKLELAYAYVPGNAEINLALGNLWFESKDEAKAGAFYQATLALAPEHKAALTNLGVLALNRSDWSGAVGLFRAALQRAQGDPKAHYLLARALFENGQQQEALGEVEAAVKLKPDQPEFVQLRERILQHQPSAALPE